MNGDRVVVYRRKDGDWSWRLTAANHRVISTAGEGYKNKSQAVKMAQRVTGREPEVIEFK